ncbi:hypothetical protein C8Q79DRAFT_515669 [Trametes meyenii]|nr:hypothetical protein C8Q79DRAFT_515669 [Trametes meyenii]
MPRTVGWCKTLIRHSLPLNLRRGRSPPTLTCASHCVVSPPASAARGGRKKFSTQRLQARAHHRRLPSRSTTRVAQRASPGQHLSSESTPRWRIVAVLLRHLSLFQSIYPLRRPRTHRSDPLDLYIVPSGPCSALRSRPS